jgi:hypothetical protein
MSVGAEEAITISSGSVTHAPSPVGAARQANLARLEGLADLLIRRGLRARIMTPPGQVPSLHVVNPLAGALAEDIYAGRGQDGLWWFWWSWAECIALSDDVEAAAARIERVLAAND